MFHELAFQIAKKAHSKQVDKAGKDYILHPMKVASYGYGYRKGSCIFT